MLYCQESHRFLDDEGGNAEENKLDEAGDGGDEEDGNSVKKEEEQMVRTPEFCVHVHYQFFLLFK